MGRSPEDRRRSLAHGHDAEECVASALRDLGWSVVARNWSGGGGELDIVAVRDGVWRLVEVKAREASDPVGLEAVDARKQARLRGAARAYLSTVDDLVLEVSFSVAFVEGGRIEWIHDAFDG